MPKQKFLQIRVTEDRKDRWREAAKNSSEWRSLTHLIVTSVEQQLHESGDDEVASNIDLGQVFDRFDDLSEQLVDIEDRLDETYFLIREDESNYTEITARIHDLIPEVSEREAVLSREPREDDRPERVVQRTGSVSHLVQLLQQEGYKPLNVKNAVERLSQNSATIEDTYARPQEEADKRIYRVED